MNLADFLAHLPDVVEGAHAKDREARRTGAARDPFGTDGARLLARRLVNQYEQTMGPQDLGDAGWTELVVALRGFTDQDWAALQRNRAAPTLTTSTDEVADSQPRPRRKIRPE